MIKLQVIASGSSGNAYALESDNEILLIECGVPWKKILKGINFQISKVVGCIATHAHNDHIVSYKDLMMNGIQIYTNDETIEHFQIISGELMYGLPENKWFKLGEFEICPFYVPHDGTPNFAYIINHPDSGYILFATDMEMAARINEEYGLLKNDGKPILRSFKNIRLNHMIIECNYSLDKLSGMDSIKKQHVGYGHHSLEACKRFVKENRTSSLRTITLIHLSEENADSEVIQASIKDLVEDDVTVNIAIPGLTVNLSQYPWG